MRDRILFYCGIHGIRMKLCLGKYSLYYRCPRYERENRENGEAVCMNRLSLQDAETIYTMAEEKAKSGQLIPGCTFQTGKLKAKVIHIDEDSIRIAVLKRKEV